MSFVKALRTLIKLFILIFIIRPFVWYFLGLNRYSRIKVPDGPVILAPNHNSHLDTVLLIGLLPLKAALRTSFVAAGDYFYDIPVLSWILFGLFEMVPVWRKQKQVEGGAAPVDRPSPIDSMSKVLEAGRVLVLFPEGTRGLPEQRVALKRGVAVLAIRFPDVPVIPIYMRGLGKTLPRGSTIFVPLIPQVVVGEALFGRERTEETFMEAIAGSFETLDEKVSKKDWVEV